MLATDGWNASGEGEKPVYTRVAGIRCTIDSNADRALREGLLLGLGLRRVIGRDHMGARPSSVRNWGKSKGFRV